MSVKIMSLNSIIQKKIDQGTHRESSINTTYLKLDLRSKFNWEGFILLRMNILNNKDMHFWILKMFLHHVVQCLSIYQDVGNTPEG